MKPVVVITSLLLAAGSASGASPDGDAALARVRERAEALGITGSSLEQLTHPVARAVHEGLPATPVADKVLEGLAKRAPTARVAAAAEEVARRLSLAHQALVESGASVPSAQRAAALDRLALAIQLEGPEAVLSMSRQSRGASAEALVAAARQLAELRRRGVEPGRAGEVLATLAREGTPPGQIERIGALLDEYRAEGGTDAAAFLDEVGSRGRAHRSLDGMIDPFAEGGDPLRPAGRPAKDRAAIDKPGAPAGAGQPALEKPGRAGSAPGFDAASHGRKTDVTKKGKLDRP